MNNDFEKIPYVVYESAQTRLERIIKRLIIALIIVTSMLFISNIIWLHEWMQFDYVTEDEVITVDSSDGIANYIGNDGDITNGTDYSKAETQE